METEAQKAELKRAYNSNIWWCRNWRRFPDGEAKLAQSATKYRELFNKHRTSRYAECSQ